MTISIFRDLVKVLPPTLTLAVHDPVGALGSVEAFI